MEKEAIIYTTKSFITNNMVIAIILVVQVSMGLMFLGIFMGLGQWETTLLFLAATVIMISLLAGETVYSISIDGISRVVSPMLLKKFGVRRSQLFAWNEIEWFKAGTDMNRDLREYRYLTIKFKGVGKKWMISDKNSNDEAFRVFQDSFITLAEAYDKMQQPIGAQLTNDGKVLKNKGIKRVKTFYETAFAKIFAVLISLLIFGLITFYALNLQYLNPSNLIKLLLIVIPGWIYLLYRVFVKRG